ncbi:lysophospholipid acyltransferase family protein [Tranquillimonas alkanivorans]|uniref:1-acyl-sn-glycerol-3-phosphate acyltransferase n=1 Tax=Tranquillimonas alkanivorans TaxID=441119 RepID=A0A1I5QSE1_9RHOB|nr:lysophospholipid acyltransferase family protein [Tranquillimonas alkanivorans]SFP49152.1 1-acyl-sn-glycerol-3-phosphate acyltransferase [Tranquillimonas alkanivorans]
MPQRSPHNDPVELRSPAMARFFTGVMERQMRGAFRAVRLARPGAAEVPADRPLIVYCNHPSWWDPAFCLLLARAAFPDRAPFAPMEAAALERYRFMRRLGVFGIAPGTRKGAAAFLATSLRVLESPDRMLWVTAQGQFRDVRDRPLELQGGVAHLMERVPDAVAVPLALEYPFWSEKRPEALAAFGNPLDGAEGLTARAWRGRLEERLRGTMDRLGALAAARDASAFDRLIAGRAGVGGVYGGWSRLRAALRGERYAPDHMAEGN